MVIKCLSATKPPPPPPKKKILFFSIKEISSFYWLLSSPIDEKVLITNCLILEPQLFYTPMANYKCKISFSKLYVKTNICKFTYTCYKIFSQIESINMYIIHSSKNLKMFLLSAYGPMHETSLKMFLLSAYGPMHETSLKMKLHW